MPLGYSLQDNIVAIGDTAKLKAWIRKSNDDTYDPSELLTVQFTIQYPDGTRNVYDGEIADDGSGFYAFQDTALEGHYVVVATFTLTDGTIKSTRESFECQDPFTEPLANPKTDIEAVGQAVWFKCEDLFDSEDGGPWLREMTLRTFNPNKMAHFINEALLDFNMTQPQSNTQLSEFTASNDFVNAPNPMMPLIVEGTFLAVIRHLMRSYVEQPDIRGGMVNYEDRRDYQLRWKQVYDVENEMYKRWVHFAKINLFGFGRTSTSLYSYSRGWWGPAFQRGRALPWAGW